MYVEKYDGIHPCLWISDPGWIALKPGSIDEGEVV